MIFNSHFAETQTKEWIDYRIGIFMKYTGKSLMNQSNQNFLCLVRYNEPTKDLVLEALSKYERLTSNILFVTNEEANFIINMVMKQSDYLYHVNIDSDNMYERNFIQAIDMYTYQEGVECLLCHEGYLYDAVYNRLSLINHYSPSLYVYIYNKDTYKLYFKERLFEPHGNAELRKHLGILGKSYMLITHQRNLDNDFEIIKNWLGEGKTIEGEEKDNILKYWGIT